MKTKILILAAAALGMAACEGEGLTTAELQEAAKERVRAELGLSEQAALFTETFVGRPVDGDTVICGIVEGRSADGTAVPPRRFIAATDPARWVKFEPASNESLPSQPRMFVEWTQTCEGASET